jgi:hypothetical protein
LFEFFPGGGGRKIAEKLSFECTACGGVLEEILAIEQALRAVMPWKRGEVAVEDERLNEGARPSLGPVVNVDALMPGVEIFEGSGTVGFGKPVGDEEGDIEVAMLEATVGDGGFVELVNADGDELNFRSGMLRFEKTSFFSECVFEVRVVAKSDAQGAHGASGRAAKDLRGFVLDRSMT